MLRVAIDDNYPPYVFRDGSGRLMGYLVDSWKLWERKTGVRVELLGSDWSTAQQLSLIHISKNTSTPTKPPGTKRVER